MKVLLDTNVISEWTLPIDAEVAEAWGLIVSKASREGTTLNPMDAFLAATAQCGGLVIATRNTD